MGFDALVALADSLVSLFTRARGYFGRRKTPVLVADPRLHSGHALRVIKAQEAQDFEVVPVEFEIDLAARVPRIELTSRAVNHLRKTLELESMRASLSVADFPRFDHLALIVEVEIPRGNSREVYCGRNLVESEIQVLREACGGPGPHRASVQLVARGWAGSKRVKTRLVSVAVTGWVRGLQDRRPSLTAS
jgi:hypothetical protein